MTSRGAPLVFGAALVFLVMLATAGLAFALGIEPFPAIRYACAANGLTSEVCTRSAITIGLLTTAVYGGVLVLGLALGWFALPSTRPSDTPDAVSPVLVVFLCAVLILLACHEASMLFGPALASRLDEADRLSNLISLENLALPLLLQLWLSVRPTTLRTVVGATLMLAMSLSPYRAMLMAVFGFGFFLPRCLDLHDWWRGRLPGATLIKRSALTAGLGIVLLVSGYIDTTLKAPSLLVEAAPQTRFADATQTSGTVQSDAPAVMPSPPAGITGAETRPPAGVLERLAQRIVFPLYQSAIAGEVARDGLVPPLIDVIARKFRLSIAPNLEEVLFRRIYGGNSRNEVTSLTYGEAAAYFPGPAVLWMVALPLTLIAAWRLLERKGLDCGTLLGMALWRSSFAGLLPILPALFLQLAGLALIDQRRWLGLAGAGTRRVLGWALGVCLAGACVIAAWSATSTIDRRTLLFVQVRFDPGCHLVSPSWVPRRLHEAGLDLGLDMWPVLAANGVSEATIAFPFGWRIPPLLDRFVPGLASLAVCTDRKGPRDGAPVEAVHLEVTRRVIYPIDPLAIVSVVWLAFALVQLVRPRDVEEIAS